MVTNNGLTLDGLSLEEQSFRDQLVFLVDRISDDSSLLDRQRVRGEIYYLIQQVLSDQDVDLFRIARSLGLESEDLLVCDQVSFLRGAIQELLVPLSEESSVTGEICNEFNAPVQLEACGQVTFKSLTNPINSGVNKALNEGSEKQFTGELIVVHGKSEQVFRALDRADVVLAQFNHVHLLEPCPHERQVRQLPYHYIDLLEYGIRIAFCLEYGNTTFIVPFSEIEKCFPDNRIDKKAIYTNDRCDSLKHNEDHDLLLAKKIRKAIGKDSAVFERGRVVLPDGRILVNPGHLPKQMRRGLSRKNVAKELKRMGKEPGDLRGVCVVHADSETPVICALWLLEDVRLAIQNLLDLESIDDLDEFRYYEGNEDGLAVVDIDGEEVEVVVLYSYLESLAKKYHFAAQRFVEAFKAKGGEPVPNLKIAMGSTKKLSVAYKKSEVDAFLESKLGRKLSEVREVFEMKQYQNGLIELDDEGMDLEGLDGNMVVNPTIYLAYLGLGAYHAASLRKKLKAAGLACRHHLCKNNSYFQDLFPLSAVNAVIVEMCSKKRLPWVLERDLLPTTSASASEAASAETAAEA